MTKSGIISNYIDECCDCDFEFFRMMMTRYMSKTKSYLLENKLFITQEILRFFDFYVREVLNDGVSYD